MYFVGNFRHLPNREAVEYLCNDVLPLLDPDAPRRHPLTVLGQLARPGRRSTSTRPRPGVQLVGLGAVGAAVRGAVRASPWCPLLHGAGVKRKVIQSMMAGTPVVTTPVGAEGLDLVQGEHALIGADAADLAAGHHPPAHRRRPLAAARRRRARRTSTPGTASTSSSAGSARSSRR